MKVLKEKWEATVHPELGQIIMVLDDTKIESEVDGLDGSAVFQVSVSLLSFLTKPDEIVEGILREVTEFGVVLQIGPIDALLHKAYLRGFLEYDDIEFDLIRQVIRSTQSKRLCRAGARLRTRIMSVSKKDAGGHRVFVTSKEPALGVWDRYWEPE